MDPEVTTAAPAAVVEDQAAVTASVNNQAPPAPPARDDDDVEVRMTKKEMRQLAQRRIDEMTRDKRGVERDRDHWREMAMRAQQGAPQPQPPPQRQEPQAPARPTLEQHGFDQEKYTEALLDWKVEQRLTEKITKASEEHRQTEQKTAEQKRVEAFGKKIAAASEKYGDFREKVLDDINLPMPKHVVEAAMELDGDNGPDVLYYLANNHDRAREIAGMSERGAAIALGRIEAQLSQQQKQATAPAPQESEPLQVSRAPAPTAVLGNRGAAVKTDPMKLSPEEWAAQRNRELFARNRAQPARRP